jgi:hypothetical protein
MPENRSGLQNGNGNASKDTISALRRRNRRKEIKNRDSDESYTRPFLASFNRTADIKKVEAQPKENDRDINGYERIKRDSCVSCL